MLLKSNQTKTSISTMNRFFDLANPWDYEYDIEEIAHSLSFLCRYTGHVNRFYSVAEHSVLVSREVDQRFAYEGLMHDASEAFCGDVSKPLKNMLPDYETIEDEVQNAISRYYDLSWPFPADVHRADIALYWAEREDIAKSSVVDTVWNKGVPPSTFKPIGLNPQEAKKLFLDRYEEVINDRF